jgi:Tfp pilus assembly protein PilX
MKSAPGTHHGPGGARRAPRAAREAGGSLLFALIALALLALAAIAVTRSVSTGSLIIGNLGFKQDAALAGDRAAETAISWIEANSSSTALEADAPASGYYASSLDALDPTGGKTAVATRAVVDWDANECDSVSGAYSTCITPSSEVAINGNRARYVITRLCAVAGSAAAAGNTCASPLIVTGSDDLNRTGYDYTKPYSLGNVSAAPMYRIVVRTVGARGTVSFAEAIVHM